MNCVVYYHEKQGTKPTVFVLDWPQKYSLDHFICTELQPCLKFQLKLEDYQIQQQYDDNVSYNLPLSITYDELTPQKLLMIRIMPKLTKNEVVELLSDIASLESEAPTEQRVASPVILFDQSMSNLSKISFSQSIKLQQHLLHEEFWQVEYNSVRISQYEGKNQHEGNVQQFLEQLLSSDIIIACSLPILSLKNLNLKNLILESCTKLLQRTINVVGQFLDKKQLIAIVRTIYGGWCLTIFSMSKTLELECVLPLTSRFYLHVEEMDDKKSQSKKSKSEHPSQNFIVQATLCIDGLPMQFKIENQNAQLLLTTLKIAYKELCGEQYGHILYEDVIKNRIQSNKLFLSLLKFMPSTKQYLLQANIEFMGQMSLVLLHNGADYDWMMWLSRLLMLFGRQSCFDQLVQGLPRSFKFLEQFIVSPPPISGEPLCIQALKDKVELLSNSCDDVQCLRFYTQYKLVLDKLEATDRQQRAEKTYPNAFKAPPIPLKYEKQVPYEPGHPRSGCMNVVALRRGFDIADSLVIGQVDVDFGADFSLFLDTALDSIQQKVKYSGTARDIIVAFKKLEAVQVIPEVFIFRRDNIETTVIFCFVNEKSPEQLSIPQTTLRFERLYGASEGNWSLFDETSVNNIRNHLNYSEFLQIQAYNFNTDPYQEVEQICDLAMDEFASITEEFCKQRIIQQYHIQNKAMRNIQYRHALHQVQNNTNLTILSDLEVLTLINTNIQFYLNEEIKTGDIWSDVQQEKFNYSFFELLIHPAIVDQQNQQNEVNHTIQKQLIDTRTQLLTESLRNVVTTEQQQLDWLKEELDAQLNGLSQIQPITQKKSLVFANNIPIESQSIILSKQLQNILQRRILQDEHQQEHQKTYKSIINSQLIDALMNCDQQQ